MLIAKKKRQMKHLSILLLAVFVHQFSIAQNSQNKVSIGISRSFYSSGDIYGNSIYAEYSKTVTQNISILSKLRGGYAHEADENQIFFNHLSNFGLDISAGYNPTNSLFKRLRVDLGLYLSIQSSTYGTIQQMLNDNHYRLENTTTQSEYTFGLVNAISYNLYESEKIELGAKGTAYFDINSAFGIESWNAGIYIGFKF